MAATFVSAFVSALESVDIGRLFYDEESWYSDLLEWCHSSVDAIERSLDPDLDHHDWRTVTDACCELNELRYEAWRESELHEYRYGGCDYDPKWRRSVESYTDVYPQRTSLLPRWRRTHAMRKAKARRLALVECGTCCSEYVCDEDIPF